MTGWILELSAIRLFVLQPGTPKTWEIFSGVSGREEEKEGRQKTREGEDPGVEKEGEVQLWVLFWPLCKGCNSVVIENMKILCAAAKQYQLLCIIADISAVESLPGKLGLVIIRRYSALSWLEAILLYSVVTIRGEFCEASYLVGKNKVVEQGSDQSLSNIGNLSPGNKSANLQAASEEET
ncbi:hypothetical protein llap_12197 [Limosa lapponica baueri]|uniref:Uncharacterized protein n=1 Tax=Limosa lapponica baueri TaxID=1758121 RepID=A0A2I0TUL0_LIMLA|nr:hypothetical protein llap_12197 [Limosa lapponica baueri]